MTMRLSIGFDWGSILHEWIVLDGLLVNSQVLFLLDNQKCKVYSGMDRSGIELLKYLNHFGRLLELTKLVILIIHESQLMLLVITPRVAGSVLVWDQNKVPSKSNTLGNDSPQCLLIIHVPATLLLIAIALFLMLSLERLVNIMNTSSKVTPDQKVLLITDGSRELTGINLSDSILQLDNLRLSYHL